MGNKTVKEGGDEKVDGKKDGIVEASDNTLFLKLGSGNQTVVKRNRTIKLHKTLKQNMAVTLGVTQLKETVALPEGEDINEWLALHCFNFVNVVKLFVQNVTDYCTEETCPVMTAHQAEYRWKYPGKNKPIALPAIKYIELSLDEITKTLEDESIFPVEDDQKFPKKFKNIYVKLIFKRIVRIYAHFFHSHFSQFKTQGADAHLNSCFRHFIYFIQEFDLCSQADLKPLQLLIDRANAKKAK